MFQKIKEWCRIRLVKLGLIEPRYVTLGDSATVNSTDASVVFLGSGDGYYTFGTTIINNWFSICWLDANIARLNNDPEHTQYVVAIETANRGWIIHSPIWWDKTRQCWVNDLDEPTTYNFSHYITVDTMLSKLRDDKS